MTRVPETMSPAPSPRSTFPPFRTSAGLLLEVAGLNLAISGTPILSNVALRIHAGKIIGVVGESGSGKTLTALTVMGLLPPGAATTGSVRMDGQDLLALDEPAMCRIRGNRIGMIFQEPMTALNPVRTIGDQVAETLLIHGMANRGEAVRIARQRLDRVGLPEPEFPLDRYPHQLSGGQRQRVCIALAIALRPQLLIADEPTTALDVSTQAQILDLLLSLVADDGMSLMLITHDLAVVASLADDIAVMRNGRVVDGAPANSLFARDGHPYTRQLLAASQHRPLRANPATEVSATSGDKTEVDIGGVPAERDHRGGDRIAGRRDATTLLRVTGAVRDYALARKGLFRKPPVRRAVDGVSFSLDAGESLGLVGESGCGKSTLARAILGLEPLQAGAITLQGTPVTAVPAVRPSLRRNMQVVFQDPYGSFNPRHRVLRLVSEPFFLNETPLSASDIRERVAESLVSVGLAPDAMEKYIHEFSGGQRQRIAIARALVLRPRLMVLDEAVSSLDVSIRAQILDLLAELQGQHDLAYLFISHDLTVIRAVTDRVIVMKTGRIVEAGETESVLESPTHPYTRHLIQSAPKIPAHWLQETGHGPPPQ